MIRTRGIGRSLLIVMTAVMGCGGDARVETETNDTSKASSVRAPSDGPTGTITGRITLDGAAATLEPFDITANGDVCGPAAKSNLLTLGPGGAIAGAVVYVEGDGGGESGERQLMDQVACQYTPRVIAAGVGSVIRFQNSDPAPHNVRVESIEKGRVHLNIAQPQQGRTDDWTVPEAGSYLVACDYHPWMNAYIVAVPGGRYAVTDSSGRYSISGVPAGRRTVRVWHNSVELAEKRDQGGRLIGYRFGEPVVREVSVDVSAHAPAVLDVAMELGKKQQTAVK